MTALPSFADEPATYPDALAVAAVERVGSVLNDTWRLDSVLGVGGSAAVYAATHRKGTRAAIKMLHAEYECNEQLRYRLEREALVLSVIHHPGAVRSYGKGTTADGSDFLIMELLEGETLASYLVRKDGRIGRDQALLITLLVLEALAGAHEYGIVHRDVTVENVFITRSGQIKLIDFGIARLLGSPDPEAEGSVGPVIGTPGFMAPEQAQGLNSEVGVHSDVWAVGAILFELLTGLPVHFEARTLFQKLTTGAFSEAPKLASIAPDASPELQNLVDRALAFDASERWRDACEMRSTLLDLFDVPPDRAGIRAFEVSFAPVAPAPPEPRGALGFLRQLRLLERLAAGFSELVVLARAVRVAWLSLRPAPRRRPRTRSRRLSNA
ncbi:MAG TPA: serine/threonine-protein kinase [Polyangiaceae bacterium]|jgi:serine/threonine-protein kinase